MDKNDLAIDLKGLKDIVLDKDYDSKQAFRSVRALENKMKEEGMTDFKGDVGFLLAYVASPQELNYKIDIILYSLGA